MGLFPRRSGDARHRHDPHCRYDRRKPQACLRGCAGIAGGLILSALALSADPIRIASFNTELEQRGPGLLLRDIVKQTPQVMAVVETIAQNNPDILVLQGVDRDHHALTAQALSQLLAEHGTDLAHTYMPPSNTGVPTGLDIDGDGRSNGPRDAQGYGRFSGQGSIALLSRWSIQSKEVRSFHDVLWKEVTDVETLKTLIPREALDRQRLASVSMAAIPIRIDRKVLWLLTHHATPPVFDGPEDRNGHRNRAENTFWLSLLDGPDATAIGNHFIIAAQFNADPASGEGHRETIRSILKSEKLQDPFGDWPSSNRHTATYPGAGELRVSYILPAVQLKILKRGISDSVADQKTGRGSRHRLIWIDIEMPE